MESERNAAAGPQTEASASALRLQIGTSGRVVTEGQAGAKSARLPCQFPPVGPGSFTSLGQGFVVMPALKTGGSRRNPCRAVLRRRVCGKNPGRGFAMLCVLMVLPAV